MICGPDIKDTIDTWKDSEQLHKEIEIRHAGIDFNIEKINIRSNVIRNLVKRKKTITGLVPISVEQYIKENDLYV